MGLENEMEPNDKDRPREMLIYNQTKNKAIVKNKYQHKNEDRKTK